MSRKIYDLKYEYANQSAAPSREARLGGGNAYGGTCSGAKTGCTANSERRFSQVQGCQLSLSLGMLNSIPKMVVITHAPLGCGSQIPTVVRSQANNKTLRGLKSTETIWINTNLGELDVVSGGEEKLKEAILYAEKEFKPDAIAVAVSCVPALIGDDVDTLVSEAQKLVSAKVFPVHCEGFKSKMVASAYDSTYHGLLKRLVNPNDTSEEVERDQKTSDEPEEKEPPKKTVNIFIAGSFSYGDSLELIRLVKALDLNAKAVPLFTSVEDISRLSDADLNVSICSTHDDYLLGHLKGRFGTPYIIDTIPVGITNTNSWLREIGKFFQIEDKVEKLIEEETRELNQALEPFKKILSGKSVYIGGGIIRVLALAEFLTGLGIKVVGVKAHHYDLFADALVDQLEGKDVEFHAAAGLPFEQANLLNRLKPDLYIGHLNNNAFVLKQGIPCMPLFGISFNYLGYAGAYETARKAAKILENTSFSKKVSANLKLPYKKDWFDKDPYSEIIY